MRKLLVTYRFTLGSANMVFYNTVPITAKIEDNLNELVYETVEKHKHDIILAICDEPRRLDGGKGRFEIINVQYFD